MDTHNSRIKPDIAICYIARFSSKRAIEKDRRRLENFLFSYRNFNAGIGHEAWIVLKGKYALQELDHVKSTAYGFNILISYDTGFDLGAYTRFMRATRTTWAFCLNSSSTILCNNWLKIFYEAGQNTGASLIGNTASWSSHGYPGNPSLEQGYLTKLKSLIKTLFSVRKRKHYPKRPNFHIRTNAFLIKSDLWLALMANKKPKSKDECHILESGFSGLSQTLLRNGDEIITVDRWSNTYIPSRWLYKGAFRTTDQANFLIIEDNQTRYYAKADQNVRKRLSFETWGVADI